jgi:hypothetical protein
VYGYAGSILDELGGRVGCLLGDDFTGELTQALNANEHTNDARNTGYFIKLTLE